MKNGELLLLTLGYWILPLTGCLGRTTAIRNSTEYSIPDELAIKEVCVPRILRTRRQTPASPKLKRRSSPGRRRGSVLIRRGEIGTGPALDITRPQSKPSSLILKVSPIPLAVPWW